MSVKKRDPLTGHLTTGHEWNGIIELNTRVPRAVWFFIGLSAFVALLMWIFLPAWPLYNTYTKGLLGVDQQTRVQQQVKAANAARADWGDKIKTLPADKIMADPDLIKRVMETAHQLFGDNCAACHGQQAQGGVGFPRLTDDAWLWGGTVPDIMETLRVGINSTDPETRVSQMLAFGKDGMLTPEQITTVVAYVRSLSGAKAPEKTIEEGAQIFADNCSSCHGEKATGNTDLGAPNLTDDFWIYGGDAETVYHTVFYGRKGWMPAWGGRLSETERKILAVYLKELGQREAAK
jgi:cytochrome c oxidase cbb3-type subunit 3